MMTSNVTYQIGAGQAVGSGIAVPVETDGKIDPSFRGI
jgi:hypothetical protein